MRKLCKIYIAAITGILLFLSELFGTNQINWNGYTQIRFQNDYRNESGFRIRRTKLWLTGPILNNSNLVFKVQGIYKMNNKGTFQLLDVFGEYRFAYGIIRIGQMVPDYSLQRSQPDYEIPVVERAAVIQSLIPSGETSARDIGILVKLHSKNKSIQSSLGMFNGNGGNHLTNEDRNFLFTHRTRIVIPLSKTSKLIPGYSLAYRKTNGLTFKKIIGNNLLFQGDDWRWGAELELVHSQWNFQFEYLEAHLENKRVYGFYFIGSRYLSPRNQIVFSIEQYHDLIENTVDDSWYILGVNHYFAKNKLKIMLDSRIQPNKQDINYMSVLQLQFFFK